MEMSFHTPNSNTQFVFRDKIMSIVDVGAGGEDAVVTFEGIAILTPRGQYSVELHLSFLQLQGQVDEFKIQYSNVVYLFLLPKSNQPHTFVIISLDPPIRKGQTLYPHIAMQFETDYVVQSTLSMSDNLFNTKYKDKLEPSYKGLIHDVFTTILHGLSGAEVTKPGKFRSCQDGYAVKSSLKAEDGILYPLEKSFFFLPKPPTLILHEEIDYVEFETHTAGGSNMHYFDLLIRLKTEQKHLFRNIPRNEFCSLSDFISSKGLKIMNSGGVQAIDGVAAVHQGDDDPVAPHLECIKYEAGRDDGDEEDEDFVPVKDDGDSPTGDFEVEESDASESGGEKEPDKKKSKKESSSKRKSENGDEDGKKKIQKKKKDPNAPKRAMSSFMFFSQTERENIRKSNPGISFTGTARAIGEKWKKMSAEEKEPYFAKVCADAVDPHLECIKNEAGGDESDEEVCTTRSEDGEKEKQKQKKDQNAPRREMSGFMFFSQMEREILKKCNPEISITDTGRLLREKWQKMSAEEKEPYEAKARAHKKRYKDEISAYKNTRAMNADSENEFDSD